MVCIPSATRHRDQEVDRANWRVFSFPFQRTRTHRQIGQKIPFLPGAIAIYVKNSPN